MVAGGVLGGVPGHAPHSGTQGWVRYQFAQFDPGVDLLVGGMVGKLRGGGQKSAAVGRYVQAGESIGHELLDERAAFGGDIRAVLVMKASPSAVVERRVTERRTACCVRSARIYASSASTWAVATSVSVCSRSRTSRICDSPRPSSRRVRARDWES